MVPQLTNNIIHHDQSVKHQQIETQREPIDISS